MPILLSDESNRSVVAAWLKMWVERFVSVKVRVLRSRVDMVLRGVAWRAELRPPTKWMALPMRVPVWPVLLTEEGD